MQASRRGIARLFFDDDLGSDVTAIPERVAHYLSHVLRLKTGDRLVVFNGRGSERLASIASLARNHAELSLAEHVEPLAESSLELVLVQALIKSDAMDTVVQKAVELGVRSIVAVKTEFSVVKLEPARVERRLSHWQRIAQSACEQSGRHRPPDIAVAASLEECLESTALQGLRVALHPGATSNLQSLPARQGPIAILVGPEGGLSATDLAVITAAGFEFAALGPRTLRADTAAVVACSLAQASWGDAGPG